MVVRKERDEPLVRRIGGRLHVGRCLDGSLQSSSSEKGAIRVMQSLFPHGFIAVRPHAALSILF